MKRFDWIAYLSVEWKFVNFYVCIWLFRNKIILLFHTSNARNLVPGLDLLPQSLFSKHNEVSLPIDISLGYQRNQSYRPTVLQIFMIFQILCPREFFINAMSCSVLAIKAKVLVTEKSHVRNDCELKNSCTCHGYRRCDIGIIFSFKMTIFTYLVVLHK